ncbi:Spermidine synthase [Collimonas arenae]|uniref:Polyamine aminopropyltransferase n=1 Tax=Collimonas arenae TaxID=279058 RepID=A0A0A1FC18_9BURK|nr:polyamine aminopropyltransferase [Collimonas arenae]AIY40402.1 Spermidine synthase [Collimonas arenae]
MQGLHLTADCYDCRCAPGLLLDPAQLRQFVVEQTIRSSLTIVGEKFHPFQAADGSAAGVTCALLLAESHLAIHTWPERQAVTLDVYVCNFTEDNSAKASGLLDALIASFAPARWQTNRLQRGSGANDQTLALEQLTQHTAYGTQLAPPLVQVQSQFQRIEIANSAEFGKVMRLDGAFMTSERDEFFYHECLVHPTALSHPQPRRALIVGGGDGGSSEELLKHPSIEHITLCEIDPLVIRLAREHLRQIHRGALNDPRVQHVAEDGFAFVKQAARAANASQLYDLILLDLTDPQNANGSALAADCYGEEFLQACRALLNTGGALVMHLGSPFHHPQRFGQLRQRLGNIFTHVSPYTVYVPLYGALWGMAVASDTLDPRRLDSHAISARLEERALGVLQYYNENVHQALFALPNFVQNLGA